MTEMIEYLKEKYQPCSIIVYGSYADRTNNQHSDLDALVISGYGETHDTSVINGVRLDVFVYPPETFEGAFDRGEFARIYDGIVVLDTDGFAENIIRNIREYVDGSPRKTRTEIDEELAWCEKMLARARRRDAEGMFRLHLLLTDSLEIFCDAANVFYHGPKKSLKWLEKHYPDGYDRCLRALSESSPEAAERWIKWIKEGLPVIGQESDKKEKNDKKEADKMRNYSQKQKELLGALIGLARSLDETNSGFEAFTVMREGLCAAENAEILPEQIEKVNAAKNSAVPDCVSCQNSCGRTHDYDLGELEKLDAGLAELKYKTLDAVIKYARETKAGAEDFQPALEKMRAALFAVGYDCFTAEQMNEKLSEITEGM